MGNLNDVLIRDLLRVVGDVGLDYRVWASYQDGYPNWDYTVFYPAIKLEVIL